MGHEMARKTPEWMAEALVGKFRASGGDLIKMTWKEFSDLYGGEKMPREEARNKIRDELLGERLLISYGNHVVSITSDQK